ncbi:glycosyltransferase family 4 protein [Haloferax prahovense]|uniref:glycosyltransferase family 4 protein n=1 Tax=Haloferax prahovense TaxID=381852 RepID=UPI0009DD0F21|nr:glycosyltransferase family 4 protein [Haloferax prahovense]
MHICYISNLYPPETIGGAEKYVRNVSEELVRRGHKVSVLTTAASDSGSVSSFNSERRNGVDVYRITPANMYTPIEHRDASPWQKPVQHIIDLWNPQIYAKFKSKLLSLEPDVIHTNNFGGLSAAVFTAAGAIDAPIIHTLHDYRLIDIRPDLFNNGEIIGVRKIMNPFRLFNKKIIEPHITQVLSPSQFVINKHKESGLFESTPCDRLKLGVSPSNSGEEINYVETDDFRILFAGQITKQKGVDILISAFEQLDQKDVRLDILGKGPEKEKLERRSEGDERIQFHGFVSEEELDRYYQLADTTVLPSRWYDNSPMVIYESYSHSTPVIGANIGGIPELIEEGITGELFDPENVKDLSNKLSLAHESFDKRMSENAHDWAQKNTLTNHVDQLENHYLSEMESK